MPGLLADVNVQGHPPYLRRLIRGLGLLDLLSGAGVTLARFPDLALDRGTDDRALWQYCQQHLWVLFTDNRNNEGPLSLEATISELWQPGDLPVITLGNRPHFAHNEPYATAVAEAVAEALFDVFCSGVRDQPRIYVHRRPV